MIEGVKLEILNKDNLYYIVDRLRSYDAKELAIMGYARDDFARHLKDEYRFVGSYNGTPVAAWGATESEQGLVVWFFATDQVANFWTTVTKIAASFLSLLQKRSPEQRVLVFVWTGHKVSMKWLTYLGFRATNQQWQLNNETVILMEMVNKGGATSAE